MLDVTDSRRMESALRERNEALEAADKVKTAFLSRMSYEFRTPLTSIGGFGEMLRDAYAAPLGAQQQSYQIGRASCSVRECQYVSTSVVAGTLKKKITTTKNIY